MEQTFDPSPIHALIGQADAQPIDVLARSLAKDAGHDWDGFHMHPGYERNRWREIAERAAA